MIRMTNIKMPLSVTESMLRAEAARRLKLPLSAIDTLTIARRSVDARDRADVHFVFTLDISTSSEAQVLKRSHCSSASLYHPQTREPVPKKRFPLSPVVVGSGPAGLFAALTLAEAGARPIVLERGDDVDTRAMKISRFWHTGVLDARSNIQFGEGGAGTFSDGKLNTGTSDMRQRYVLEEFVACGAPAEILFQAKPHIGTDYLRRVIRRLRKKIQSLGGVFLFGHLLTELLTENNTLCGVRYQTPTGTVETLRCDRVVLAVGHSARDTFSMLHDAGISMTQKAFSVGVRIEHPQAMINTAQYGAFAGHPALSAADYKLAAHLPGGRSVYTFCMCPGGVVVAAASEEGGVCTNGMSYFARDKENANSALLVGVTPADFGGDGPLAGVRFQQKLERAAFSLGGGNYRAPVQMVGDFLEGRASSVLGSVMPSYLPGVTPCDLRALFPAELSGALREGILRFDRALRGFAFPDAVMTGIESRSSSPVRILRGDTMEASIAGLYPCGEGAGYAGGILSAAVDGMRVGEAILGT